MLLPSAPNAHNIFGVLLLRKSPAPTATGLAVLPLLFRAAAAAAVAAAAAARSGLAVLALLVRMLVRAAADDVG